MKKITMAQQIVFEVLTCGDQYYEIGRYKYIKNSSSIEAAIRTGKVKIKSKKRNEYGTGYQWVELERTETNTNITNTTVNKIKLLEAEHRTAILTARAYVNDTKDFGFEPTELDKMQAQAQQILLKIKLLKTSL
jgi:hypothetical protein